MAHRDIRILRRRPYFQVSPFLFVTCKANGYPKKDMCVMAPQDVTHADRMAREDYNRYCDLVDMSKEAR
jgi:hypothetical protein